MKRKHYPLLYQVNARILLQQLTRDKGTRITLDDVPDSLLKQWAESGYEWIYLLGAWQTGTAGRRVSSTHEQWRMEYTEALPDLKDEDITGSCFAITGYKAHKEMGGNKALASFRERLHARGLKLMLDFIPNHTAIDHPWVKDHPGYYLEGNPKKLSEQPENYIEVDTGEGRLALAYGRDPNFPGWPDTLQLNYGNPELQKAMAGELKKVAGLCDGVRCDMAMLILPEVFMKTWRVYMNDFWTDAIEKTKEKHPGFLFLAEVYWDMEWHLMGLGFDYCYDKRLYDRLVSSAATPVRDHLRADINFQSRLARFLENHDEKRAAGVFPGKKLEAAAVISYLIPGMRFFQMGREKGYRIKVPVHLSRGPEETTDEPTSLFYNRLLELLKMPMYKEGHWHMLECLPSSSDNRTYLDFIAYLWADEKGNWSLVCVNYSGNQGQCFVRLPCPALTGSQWMLDDLLGQDRYVRDGYEMLTTGLYLDMGAWGYHVFGFDRLEE